MKLRNEMESYFQRSKPVSLVNVSIISLFAIVFACFSVVLYVFPTSQNSNSTWGAIVLGALANCIWTFILYLIYVVVSNLLYVRSRESVRKFFELNDPDARYTIYLSNLFIQKNGAISLSDISGGATGPAVSHLEYLAGSQLADLLQTNLVNPEAPFAVFDILGRFIFKAKAVPVKIRVSPLPEGLDASEDNLDGSVKTAKFNWDEIKTNQRFWRETIDDEGNIIVLGSDIYNSVCKFYVDIFYETRKKELLNFIGFESSADEQQRILYIRTRLSLPNEEGFDSRMSQSFGREGNLVPGFIMKFRYRISDLGSQVVNLRTVIICAGIDSVATAAAAVYLKNNFEELNMLSRGEDFIQVLHHTDLKTKVNDLKDLPPAAPRVVLTRVWDTH